MYAEAFGFGAGACVAGCCGGGGGFDPFAQFRSMPNIFSPNNSLQVKNYFSFVFYYYFITCSILNISGYGIIPNGEPHDHSGHDHGDDTDDYESDDDYDSEDFEDVDEEASVKDNGDEGEDDDEDEDGNKNEKDNEEDGEPQTKKRKTEDGD